MATRRRRRKSSKRGGASASTGCKTKLKSCLKSGPALSKTVSSKCFTAFNKCRSPKRKARRK
jgi:hypothetical protein